MNAVRTYRGRDVFSQRGIEVKVLDTSFDDVRTCEDYDEDIWLCPGFVDLQVNGYGGIDLNDDSCTAADVARLAERLSSLGTTTFLPTIITASQQAMVARVRTVAEVRRRYSRVKDAVPCIHLEGPNISPIEGYRGAHPLNDVREPSRAEFQELQEAAEGLIGLVTLSPHWSSSTEYIRALTEAGVVVALGHTHASPEMIRAAVDAGARLSTHLGNGIAAQLARHPNPIWTQLAEEGLAASVIADGVHLSEEVLRVILRAKGLDRCVLVSDSVSLAGSPAGLYQSNIGNEVVVGDDGSIRMADGGLLAGSGIALRDAVAYVAAMPGYSLSDAVRMATVNAAGFISAVPARIATGVPADMVIVRWSPDHPALHIEQVLVKGRAILPQPS